MVEKSIPNESNKKKLIIKRDPERLAEILKQNLSRRKNKITHEETDD